jgi:hypothetical protein
VATRKPCGPERSRGRALGGEAETCGAREARRAARESAKRSRRARQPRGLEPEPCRALTGAGWRAKRAARTGETEPAGARGVWYRTGAVPRVNRPGWRANRRSGAVWLVNRSRMERALAGQTALRSGAVRTSFGWSSALRSGAVRTSLGWSKCLRPWIRRSAHSARRWCLVATIRSLGGLYTKASSAPLPECVFLDPFTDASILPVS